MFIMANKFRFYILKGFQRYHVAQAGEFRYPTPIGNPSVKRYGIKKKKERKDEAVCVLPALCR